MRLWVASCCRTGEAASEATTSASSAPLDGGGFRSPKTARRMTSMTRTVAGPRGGGTRALSCVRTKMGVLVLAS